jgi:hypothetical protein
MRSDAKGAASTLVKGRAASTATVAAIHVRRENIVKLIQPPQLIQSSDPTAILPADLSRRPNDDHGRASNQCN